MIRTLVLPLAGLFASCLALAAPSTAVRAQEPIRIGVVLPFTGPFAKGGLEDWTAMEIARDMINEKGGINGRKIEYLRGDAVNPNAAISEAERLITQDGVKITYPRMRRFFRGRRIPRAEPYNGPDRGGRLRVRLNPS